MGTSTDGVLAFGIRFDEGDEPWKDAEDFETWVCTFYPEDAIKRPADPVDWSKRTVEEDTEWKVYWAANRELLRKIPVDYENYCSGDYPMEALVVKASVTRCYRGEPAELNAEQLREMSDKTPEYERVLKAFCKKAGIECKPSWLLMSYWG